MVKSGVISIIGRPNSGKSTLLNSILGTELSIVSPKAQTTREKILGILSGPEGQILFSDTPGIHLAKDGGINAYMMDQVREALQGVDLIWYLIDPESSIKRETLVLNLMKESGAGAPIQPVLGKSDLKGRVALMGSELLTQIQAEADLLGLVLLEPVTVSGLKNKGVTELLNRSWERMPEGPTHYPDQEQISDRPIRFFVAEKIRSQIFSQLGDELPYSCAVEITSFKESADPKVKTKIEATIHVERDSQKGIVVGAGGKKIKSIGQSAREEIEVFTGQPVYLGLTVKVKKDWTRNPDALRALGYQTRPLKG